MADRNKIVKFMSDYLKVDKFQDDCFNGLQIEGKSEVKKIITGVSLSEKFIQKAIEKKADMILVHHGLFSKHFGELPRIIGHRKNRLKLILTNDINLCGFHLPLDAHPKIGNNISLCNLFGIKKITPLEVGFYGELQTEINFEKLVDLVKEKIHPNPYVIPAGPKKVKRIGIISGGSSPEVKYAIEARCDTYICGDIREHTVREIEEVKINFINAGHYNTEKLGIQNLGELVSQKFKIPVEFVDIPNDI